MCESWNQNHRNVGIFSGKGRITLTASVIRQGELAAYAEGLACTLSPIEIELGALKTGEAPSECLHCRVGSIGEDDPTRPWSYRDPSQR